MFLKQAATLSVLLYLLTLGLLHVAMPTIARTCRVQSCERQSKLESRGYDAVKEPVQIDVGTCTEVYEESEDCNKPVANQVLLPQEGSGHQTEACPRRCEPRSYSRISTSNRDRPLSVTVIRSCYRTRHQCIQGCVVKPSYVYMFPGSKYQQRVDVGKCVGKCANSTLECVATRHRSIAIEGPNGYETVQKIEECSCENTLCYRADHFQSFSELVNDYNNNTTTQKKRKEKLINVGKCVGSCPGVTIPGTCYPSDNNCLLYVGERKAYCVPTVGEKHTYTDLDGKEKTVAAVVECGCGSG